MGDIARKVKLCGLTATGSLALPWRRCPEVDAIVDTGATCTVIPRRLAREIRATIIRRGARWQGRPRDTALAAVRLAGRGCQPTAHLLMIDDDLAAQAGGSARIILGHDYLQQSRVRITFRQPHELTTVSCAPRGERRRGSRSGR